MINPVELFVGLRYLRAKRRTRFVSFITLISLIGIALGVAALIVILSVMNGFEGELRGRLLSMSAHGFVTGSGGVTRDWRQLVEELGVNRKTMYAEFGSKQELFEATLEHYDRKHLTRMLADIDGDGQCELVTGKRYTARLLAVDAQWDCAVLDIGQPEDLDVEPAELEWGEHALNKRPDALVTTAALFGSVEH